MNALLSLPALNHQPLLWQRKAGAEYMLLREVILDEDEFRTKQTLEINKEMELIDQGLNTWNRSSSGNGTRHYNLPLACHASLRLASEVAD